ncbi:MAG: phosphate/sulfate permease [Cyanobacteria bacterium RYN_339]|nr:phosphate/sulfate permease [Cyanobacteria bacterium RYN_339]
MPEVSLLLAAVIALALVFTFINGFHDTANAIACSVSTKVLSPRQAIALAAVMNFLGAMWSTKVAATIGKGIIDPQFATSQLVIAALVSAIIWNLLTWYYALPSSSSHALIGGVMGAGVAGHGTGVLRLHAIGEMLESLVISPFIGFFIGMALVLALFYTFREWAPRRVREIFRPAQVLAAALISFTHGANDAQKSMGIILLALIGGHMLAANADVPLWVKITCTIAMAAGTAVGGWKIIKTMGGKVVKLQPLTGFAVDLTSAGVILAATQFGLPVSTTHVVAGSIMGVGSSKRLSAVRWGVAGNMLVAWVVTIPITFALAWGFYLGLDLVNHHQLNRAAAGALAEVAR